MKTIAYYKLMQDTGMTQEPEELGTFYKYSDAMAAFEITKKRKTFSNCTYIEPVYVDFMSLDEFKKIEGV